MIHQNSRRAFIGGLVLLSAGAALESAAGGLLPIIKDDLKKQWKSFCRENNGQLHAEPPSQLNSSIPPCAGHFYQPGGLVYFPAVDVFAQPTWVYWGKQKANPCDLVVSFYRNDDTNNPLFRLNHFELEGLKALQEEHPAICLPVILKEMDQGTGEIKNNRSLFRVTTRIDREQWARTVAKYAPHQIAFQNQLFHNA